MKLFIVQTTDSRNKLKMPVVTTKVFKKKQSAIDYFNEEKNFYLTNWKELEENPKSFFGVQAYPKDKVQTYHLFKYANDTNQGIYIEVIEAPLW